MKYLPRQRMPFRRTVKGNSGVRVESRAWESLLYVGFGVGADLFTADVRRKPAFNDSGSGQEPDGGFDLESGKRASVNTG
jgi:hypothetical protein